MSPPASSTTRGLRQTGEQRSRANGIGRASRSTPTVAHTNAAFTNSFAELLSLDIRWSELLPSFEQLDEILGDPAAALEAALSYLSDVSSLIDFDLAYFMQGVAELTAINFALALLKLLATYSCCLFALHVD